MLDAMTGIRFGAGIVVLGGRSFEGQIAAGTDGWVDVEDKDYGNVSVPSSAVRYINWNESGEDN
jgi:hypothetical protein